MLWVKLLLVCLIVMVMVCFIIFLEIVVFDDCGILFKCSVCDFVFKVLGD